MYSTQSPDVASQSPTHYVGPHHDVTVQQVRTSFSCSFFSPQMNTRTLLFPNPRYAKARTQVISSQEVYDK